LNGTYASIEARDTASAYSLDCWLGLGNGEFLDLVDLSGGTILMV
jgi:hypothetical protein